MELRLVILDVVHLLVGLVPVDDNHCIALAWGNFGERGDPIEYNTKEGCERIEAGEIMNRTLGRKTKKTWGCRSC